MFGLKFSYLDFEAVNVWGFWGLAENRGDKKNKKKRRSINIHEILKKKQLGSAWSVDPMWRLLYIRLIRFMILNMIYVNLSQIS